MTFINKFSKWLNKFNHLIEENGFYADDLDYILDEDNYVFPTNMENVINLYTDILIYLKSNKPNYICWININLNSVFLDDEITNLTYRNKFNPVFKKTYRDLEASLNDHSMTPPTIFIEKEKFKNAINSNNISHETFKLYYSEEVYTKKISEGHILINYRCYTERKYVSELNKDLRVFYISE